LLAVVAISFSVADGVELAEPESFSGGYDLGEAQGPVQAPAAPVVVSSTNPVPLDAIALNKKVEERKKLDLERVRMLLRNPVLDPVQENAFKTAAIVVAASKKQLMTELETVEEMQVLTVKFSEAQAKKAAALAGKSAQQTLSAEDAVESAVKASGCVDQHAGICKGVQLQGHCGIEVYAQDCKVSCHLCSAPILPTAGTDSVASEEKQKYEIRRAGTTAATAEKLELQAKEKATLGNIEKMKVKVQQRQIGILEKTEKIGRQKEIVLGMAAPSEAEVKSQKIKVLKSEEQVEKDEASLKLVSTEPRKEKVGGKGKIKSAKKKMKSDSKQGKKLDKKEKRNSKNLAKEQKELDKLNLKRAKFSGDKEMTAKSMKVVRKSEKKKNKAEKRERKAKQKGRTMRSDALRKLQLDSRNADRYYSAQVEMDKSAASRLQELVSAARLKADRMEMLNKLQEKKLADMSAPGAKEKLERELELAEAEVVHVRKSLNEYGKEFKELVKYKPDLVDAYDCQEQGDDSACELLSRALKSAKVAKQSAQEGINKLSELKNGPVAKKIRHKEVQIKIEMTMETSKLAAAKNKRKVLLETLKTAKKRSASIKKQAEKMEKSVLKDALDIPKIAEKANEKAAKAVKKAMQVALKDASKMRKDAVPENLIKVQDKKLQRLRKQHETIQKSLRKNQKKKDADMKRIAEAEAARSKAKIVRNRQLKLAKKLAAKAVTERKNTLSAAKAQVKADRLVLDGLEKQIHNKRTSANKLKREEEDLVIMKNALAERKGAEEAAKQADEFDSQAMDAKVAAAEMKGKTGEERTDEQEEANEKKAKARSARISNIISQSGLTGALAIKSRARVETAMQKAQLQTEKKGEIRVKKAITKIVEKAAAGPSKVERLTRKIRKEASATATKGGKDAMEADRKAKAALDAKIKAATDAITKETSMAVSQSEQKAADEALMTIAAEGLNSKDTMTLASSSSSSRSSRSSSSISSDVHGNLCATVKQQGHCGKPSYAKFCPSACGDAAAKTKAKAFEEAKVVAKATAKVEAFEQAKAAVTETSLSKPTLKDSVDSPIETLEEQLSASIQDAKKAIVHAKTTVSSAAKGLS